VTPGDGSACPLCDAPIRPRARFCGACGRDLTHGGESIPNAGDVRRAMGAVGILFLGVLAVLILAGQLMPEPTSTLAEAGQEAVLCIGFVLVGLAAAMRLGRGSLRESLAGPATEREVALGFLVGAGLIVFNMIWLTGLNVMLGEGLGFVGMGLPEQIVPLLLGTALLPAVFEEWFDRGVLWTALQRLTDERTTIFLTAALFAMSHGLGGGQEWELPSRFIIGLVLGWLRARTGSLWPCIAAHFTNNALACLIL